MVAKTEQQDDCGRVDRDTSLYIDETLGRMDDLGAREVARLLAEKGVGFAVTVRVTAETSRRRALRAVDEPTQRRDVDAPARESVASAFSGER